jgi:hypothetical protein
MKEMAGFLPGPLSHFLFRFQAHRRSVAILPSALVVEQKLLVASWAFLVSVGAAT